MAKMHEAMAKDIQRAAAVVAVKNGRAPLRQAVIDYLGTAKGPFYLKVQKEVLITPTRPVRAVEIKLSNKAFVLPESVRTKLGLTDGSLLAMVRRTDAVALKRAEPEVIEAARASLEAVPQVSAITRCSAAGKVALKANVTKRLGKGPYYLQTNGEVVFTTRKTTGAEPATVEKTRLILPPEVARTLGLDGGGRVALIEREDGVAIKRFELIEREGQEAKASDIETPQVITRVAETNPPPETMLDRLTEAARGARLKYDVLAFLKGRETLDAWRTRRILGKADEADESLRKRLVRERLDAQSADGSWEGETVLTARMLRELADLQVKPTTAEVAAGVNWLLNCRETDLEPGFFLLSDHVTGEMERIYEARKRGSKERFRKGHSQFPAAELELAMKGDDLVCMPCGPRVTWPNGYALEALIALGHEDAPRVMRAIGSFMSGGWCECGRQGHRGRKTVLLPVKQLAERESKERSEFRLGGIPDLDELAKMDQGKSWGLRMPRVGCRRQRGRTVYPLQMPDGFSPCGLIPLRAMSRAKDRRIRKYAEGSLWKLAIAASDADGSDPGWQRFHCGRAGLLQIFAGFDHPAATIGIMRWLPWIVGAQNRDGSWGPQAHRDAATFAVVSALNRVKDRLPKGFGPCLSTR